MRKKKAEHGISLNPGMHVTLETPRIAMTLGGDEALVRSAIEQEAEMHASRMRGACVPEARIQEDKARCVEALVQAARSRKVI